MAKKKSEAAPAPITDRELRARQIVQAITGCGVPEAESRLAQFTDEQIAKMLELDQIGKRSQIVVMLYAAESDPETDGETPVDEVV